MLIKILDKIDYYVVSMTYSDNLYLEYFTADHFNPQNLSGQAGCMPWIRGIIFCMTVPKRSSKKVTL